MQRHPEVTRYALERAKATLATLQADLDHLVNGGEELPFNTERHLFDVRVALDQAKRKIAAAIAGRAHA